MASPRSRHLMLTVRRPLALPYIHELVSAFTSTLNLFRLSALSPFPFLCLARTDDVKCWQGIHIGYVVAGLFALLIYFASAVSCTMEMLAHKPYADRRCDGIRYDWHYVKVSFQVKCFLAAAVAFFGNASDDDERKWFFVFMIMVANIALMLHHTMSQPCTMGGVNWVRALTLVASGWSVVAAVVAVALDDESNSLSYDVFKYGIAVIVGIFLGLLIWRIQSEKSRADAGGGAVSRAHSESVARLEQLLYDGTRLAQARSRAALPEGQQDRQSLNINEVDSDAATSAADNTPSINQSKNPVLDSV